MANGGRVVDQVRRVQLEADRVSGPAATAQFDWVTPLAVLLVGSALLFVPVTHDGIWQVWLGRQMLHGARLYTDLIEVNPPLWFWTAVPLAALGEATGASARLIVVLFFVAAIGVSLFLTPRKFRLLLLAVLVLIPLHDFGQREHFALIATAPYVFAIAARARGEAPRHPLAIGLFAAFGLCLKPYFLLLPVGLELFIWSRKRVRPETLALLAFVVGYALSIILFARDYLTETIPLIRRFYGDFGEQPNYLLLGGAVLLAAAGAWLGRRRGSADSRALIIASLMFVPAVLIQAKGFSYHSIPVRGFLCLAILVELIRHRGNPIADGLLFSSAILSCMPFGTYRNSFEPQMEQHLAGVPPNSTIIVLASNPSVAWPMVEDHQLHWQLHEFSVWQIAATIRNPSLRTEVRRIIAPDLAKHPTVLIIDRRPDVGPAAQALVPECYLAGYTPKLRTTLMESYVRKRLPPRDAC